MNKMRHLRIAAGLVVLAIALICAAGNLPIGTLCALCPAGFAQIAVASRSVPWELLPGVLILLVAAFLAGRAFCSWVCPTGLLKGFFAGKAPRAIASQSGCSACGGEGVSKGGLASQAAILLTLLVVSFIVHFPVFCLICPIGLAFGTVFAIFRTFVTWQPEWDLLVFPAILLVEVLLLRRWCSAICPLGFFFNVLSRLGLRSGIAVRPRVNRGKCLNSQGCKSCMTVCREGVNITSVGDESRMNDEPCEQEDALELALSHGMENCTLCLDCLDHCPTKAVGLGCNGRSPE